MSWFSNRFSVSFKAPEGHHGNDEQDDEETSQGKGVKEDLSELTKTFTRQLWGVASFLAPPPTNKEQVDPSSPSPSDHHIQPDLQIDSFSQPDETALSNELVDIDFQASIGPAEVSQEDALHRPSILEQWQTPADDKSIHQSSDHGLTGISKDLAELKGSVATGFSRILKVVKEEIDRNEDAKERRDYDDDDNDGESESSVHARRLTVFNSLLKPLFSGILPNDGDERWKTKSADEGLDDEEEEGFDDDPMDVHGHRMSRPPVDFNLQRSLGESLGSISKLASSLFPVSLDSDDEDDAAKTVLIREGVGVTEEVLAFARNISMHPETWLDFPLFTHDDEDDDFEMSNAQKEHVHEVELASPRLAALRIELCPDHMSKGRFWKIYFVLLHSRLSKTDAVLLSTPQIMEARARLNNLQKKEFQGNIAEDGPSELEGKDSARLLNPTPGTAQSFKIVSLQSAMKVPAIDFDQIENLGGNQGRPQKSGQITTDTAEEVQNKNVLASTVKLATLNYEEEEADADRWLHEESSPHLRSATAELGNEEDVSFSDLEEDEDSLMSKGVGSSNFKGSHGWVQLDDQEEQEFEGLGIPSSSKLDGKRQALGTQKHDRREPNDWLTVEEDDVDSSDFA